MGQREIRRILRVGRLPQLVNAPIRTAVIDEDLFQDLKQYLRFRHLFRNIYRFELKCIQFADLVTSLDDLRKRVKSALDEFLESDGVSVC